MICIKFLFDVAFNLFGAYNHLTHDFRHKRLCLVGGSLYFLVADHHRVVEATEIGDDRDAKGADATVVGYDDFRYGRHTYGIATQQTIHLIFCRCLKGRTLNTDIDAMLHLDTLLLGNLVGQCNEIQVVGLVHIRESWACGEVLATERMFREEVDMVGDNHQVTDAECRVHATCSITDEKRLDAQLIHHPDGERHFFHRITLIEVEAPLHGKDVYATEFAEDEFTAMALNGGYGEVGNIGIRKLRLVRYF